MNECMTIAMIRRLLVFCLALPAVCPAQEQAVQWRVSTEKKSDTLLKITAVADLTPGWYIYAEDDSSTGVHGVQFQFDKEAIRAINVPVPDATAEAIKDPLFENRSMKVFNHSATFTQDVRIDNTALSQLRVTISGFAANRQEFLPFEQRFSVSLSETASAQLKEEMELKNLRLSAPVSDCGETQQSQKGMLVIFLLGFGGGLIALLTPCVFPMIPVTVSFFANKAGSRKQAMMRSAWYAIFIAGIYLVASLPFHITSGINPELFNRVSTSAGLNIFFFIVFTLFALSFFGLFDITLPSFFASKAGSKSDASNMGGIFFMALTLAIVSFSCTGPILGSLLAGSLSGESDPWQLTAGMGGFGVALALPFALFALFPQWLKVLPKSGGWLGTFKKTLAFAELALALKFLSNADLVQHWGLLKREVFIGIWILIAGGLALYLLNIGEFLQKGRRGVSPVRLTAGLLVLAFVFYLLPGLSPYETAHLNLVSGFPPPLSYSVYGKNEVREKALNKTIVNDYALALAMSRAEHKPILIDFTGWACVNCRKMEEQVWTEPEISELIKEKYILVSLYVDDRKKLPPADRFTYQFADGKVKEIETTGDQWETFQTENFAQAAQPLYVALSPEGKLLTNPVGYTPNAVKYRDWLECGLKAYQSE